MAAYTAAVITVSDKGTRGERTDTSGPAVCAMLADAGYEVIRTRIVPDERDQIKEELLHCADRLACALVITTGGTGFSPRDITPEATLDIVERQTPGLPEAMRAESMKITPHGCLSRGAAGIRGRTLIVNLPGSEKAAKENLGAVLGAVGHGIKMLYSEGSADCAISGPARQEPEGCGGLIRSSARPSLDAWIREAKREISAHGVGMYLVHNGVVRESARSVVREGAENVAPVTGMYFTYDEEKVRAAIRKTQGSEGIFHVRVWLADGELKVGDDIMCVLIGGDTRPHTIAALESLVGEIKKNCVTEEERF